jgi:hypothetical protein
MAGTMTKAESHRALRGSCQLLVLSLIIMPSVAGCPESTTEDPPRCPDPEADGGVAVDDYCPTFASILADGYVGCCGETDVEQYRARIEAECEAGEISSIRGGFSCLDGPVARRCLDAWRASLASCQYDDDLDNACRFQWYGQAGPGEPCRDVWHCQRGLGCQIEGTSGICIELPGEGESCGESTVCQPGGFYCSYDDWICHSRVGLGEPCERSDMCEIGVCTEGGSCEGVPWFRCEE